MKSLKRFKLAQTLLFLLAIFFVPKGQSVQSQTKTIQSLPNGLYNFCDLPETAPREMFAMCFSFRKSGNHIVGVHYPDRSDFEDICIEGKVKNNTVTGFALESVEGKPLSEHMPTSEGVNLVNWQDGRDNKGYLKVGKKRVVKRTPNEFTTGWVRFDKAMLNLNNFHTWKYIDKVPTSCSIKAIENLVKF